MPAHPITRYSAGQKHNLYARNFRDSEWGIFDRMSDDPGSPIIIFNDFEEAEAYCYLLKDTPFKKS